MKRRHHSEAMAKIAGVTSDAFALARVGDRVVTIDGPGMVANVYDGPYPNTETYEIVLDNGAGGGEYDAGQITEVVGQVTARRYSQTPMACDRCGSPASKSLAGGLQGHTMLCDDCIAKSKGLRQGAEKRESAERTAARSALPLLAPEELKAQGLHTAADDYPQLAEILWDRPDLVEAEPVAGMSRRISLGSKTYPTDTGEHIDRIKAAEVMYGTGSPQHLKAIERFSPKTASKPPTARQVGQAWVRYFGNASAIRQAADELLGLAETPRGIDRPWAAISDIDDPEEYARVMLEEAAKAGAPLPMNGNKFARPPGTPALVGGTSSVPLYRSMILEGGDFGQFMEDHRVGAQISLSLAAAAPNISLVTKMMQVRDYNGRSREVKAPDGDYYPVMIVFQPPVPGIGRGSDEFIVSGKFKVAKVEGSEMLPVTLNPTARYDTQIMGVRITMETVGSHQFSGSYADGRWDHLWATAKPIEPDWLKDRSKSGPIKDSLTDKDQPWWWRKLVGPAIDRYNDNVPDGRKITDYDELHQIPAKQWCRFRRDGDCYFPKDLDEASTAEAGYAVWTPYHRGECPWKTQKAQKYECKVSEPGPDSGEKTVYPDATIPWSQGGQRMSSVAVSITRKPEHTAKWVDVREKAKRIRQTGGVRIIAVADNSVTAEVRGDTGLYTATVTTVPGTNQIALATCSCPWETYRWARSGPWKNLEGRSCAHITALLYEMQARKMYGGEITEDAGTPEWRTEQPALENPKSRPEPWRLDSAASLQGHLTAVALRFRAMESDSAADVSLDPQVAALGFAVEAMRLGQIEPINPSLIISEARSLTDVEPFYAQVRGEIVIVDGFDEDGIAWANGRELEPRDLLYPTFHPTLGLHASLKTSLFAEAAGERRGVMVALVPGPELAEAMSKAALDAGFEAETPDQIHLTVAYLGKPDVVDRGRFMAAVQGIALAAGRLEGKVSGFGTFSNGGENVLWASLDIPGLDLLRTMVVEGLAAVGIPTPMEHGFTPHMTLAYSSDPVVELPPSEGIAGSPLLFTKLVGVYNGEWVHFDLDDPAGEPAFSVEKTSALATDLPQDVLDACTAGGYGYAGLVVRAADSGRVLMTQRTPYHGDDEATYGSWEFPGGSIEEGETALDAAMREFREETGLSLPEGYRIDGCSPNDEYLAIMVTVPNEAWTTHAELLPLETMGIGWFHPDHVEETPITRPEVDDADWDMIRESALSDRPENPAEDNGFVVQDLMTLRFLPDWFPTMEAAQAAIDERGIIARIVRSDERRLGWFEAKLAVSSSYRYHLTNKADFKLDPKKHPDNNTTLGGDLGAGIFLGPTDWVEHWLNGYGYWRPWVVEIDTSGAQPDPGKGGYGQEEFYPASEYSKMRIVRVLPLDAFCREQYGSWGWVEEDLGVAFDTGKPIEEVDTFNQRVSWDVIYPFRGWTYPGDARNESSAWQQEYAKKVKRFGRTKNNAIASLAVDGVVVGNAVAESSQEIEAILHDAPEPALPEAYGVADDPMRFDEMDPSLFSTSYTEPSSVSNRNEPNDPFTNEMSATGAAIPDQRLAWLLDEPAPADDGDIAAAASAFLAKQALKTFSITEQNDLIHEGAEDNRGSRNDDRLSVEGTHYEADLASVPDNELLW